MKTNIKAKNGKSFPDLNKDGKITKADILKGRGVIAKKGATVKKAQYGGKAASMVPTKKAKSGKKVEKAFLGSLLGGGAGGGMLGGMLGGGGGGGLLGNMFGGGGGGLGGGLNKIMGSLGRKKTPPANVMDNKTMKKGGSVKKKAGMHKMPDGSMMKNSKMKMGGTIKKAQDGVKTTPAFTVAKEKQREKEDLSKRNKKITKPKAKSGTSIKKCKYGCK